MSATSAGKGWFSIEDSTEQDSKPTTEEIDAFNAKYGQMVNDLYAHLTNVEDAQEFYMLGRALVAVVGVATDERKKKLNEKIN